MKIVIYYKHPGRTELRDVEVDVPWDVIAEYKINHVGMSDEVVMNEIAKVYLDALRGKNVDYFGWQRVD